MPEPISKPRYSISVKSQVIELPPVHDVLVLAKKHPHGKEGVMGAFRFIAPDEFEMFSIDDVCVVEAVMINKKILGRLPPEKVIDLLRTYVFPYVSPGEALNVDLDIEMSFEGITIDGERIAP